MRILRGIDPVLEKAGERMKDVVRTPNGEFFRDLSHASTIVSVTGGSDPNMLVVSEADACIGV